MTTGRTDTGREQQEDAAFTRCETDRGERVVEAPSRELPRRLVYKHTRPGELADDDAVRLGLADRRPVA